MKLSKYKKELFDCLIYNGMPKSTAYKFIRKSDYVTELIITAYDSNKITNGDKFLLLWGIKHAKST
jgi:hypothetical protein